MKRYAHSVIETSRALAEHAMGSMDGFSQSDLDERATWLEWRISEEEWQPPSGTPQQQAYQAQVRELARAALAMKG